MNPSKLLLRRFPVRGSLAAFTLIELLVVISIIAVLAGLLLPVVSRVTENARKVETKSAEVQICTSIRNFQTDYGQYPVPAGTTADLSYSTSGNAALFKVLRNTEAATDTILNTRHIVYFEGKDVKNAAAPKGGFATAGATGNNGVSINIGDFVDSWGNLYFIAIDSSYNDVVGNPYGGNSDTSTTASDIVRTGAIAWSYGSDGKKGLNNSFTATSFGDDVVSWQ